MGVHSWRKESNQRIKKANRTSEVFVGIWLDPVHKQYQITFDNIHMSWYVAICIEQKTERRLYLESISSSGTFPLPCILHHRLGIGYQLCIVRVYFGFCN